MSSTYGKNIRVTIFGESHAAAIGVTIEGLPAGIAIDTEELQAFLDRRAPGRDRFSTARKESDTPEFLCGVKNGTTCGTPVTAIIRNSDLTLIANDTLSMHQREGGGTNCGEYNQYFEVREDNYDLILTWGR